MESSGIDPFSVLYHRPDGLGGGVKEPFPSSSLSIVPYSFNFDLTIIFASPFLFRNKVPLARLFLAFVCLLSM